MSSKFNPYAEWFGLNPSSKPTYYELLGVPNFETEPPVIAEAAELRLQLLQAHRGGPNTETAERLSREVTGVMNVLLSPDKRRAYDEQLRQQAPAAQAPIAPSTNLPPSLDAADSPTMMLPPGALSMPPAGLPQPTMPGANPYGTYPGYGAPPQAAPNYGAPNGYPDYGTQPGYAAAAPGMSAPGMMPPNPQYAAAPSYPAAASPYAQAAAPAGYAPGYPAAAQPAYAAAPQTMSPAPSMPSAATMPMPSGGSAYASSNVSQRTRLAGARKQKSSHTMMATAIIGGAGVVLFVLILAVSASLSKSKNSAAQPKVVAKKPVQLPQDASLNQFEKAIMSMPPPLQSADDFGNPGYAYRSTPDEVLKNEARMRDMPNGEGFGNLTMPDLITKMAPKGVTPSIATPAPSGTPPTFTTPATPPSPTPTPTPSATAMVAVGTTPAPSTPPSTPVLSGLAPTDVKMEAALPPDAAREKTVNTMLGAARSALKKRDYAKAEEIVLQTQVMADTPALINSTYEHGRVVEHIRVFWNAVREGAKALTEGEELTFAGQAAKVVKHDDLSIVVKQNNKDVVLQIDKLLPGLAVILAERGLPANDPATKIAVACFLATDQVGDREKAMLLLSEAAAAGTDVTNLKAALSDAP